MNAVAILPAAISRDHVQSSLRCATVTAPENADEFRASLRQRAEAAKGLEKDFLSEVPLLYGGPDSMAPDGDPGTRLARIHRDDLKRRNGGGVPNSATKRSEVALPFDRGMLILGLILLALAFFLD